MAQSLVFLGATSADENQLFQVASATDGASTIDLLGYPSGGASITDLTAFGGRLYFSGGMPGSTQLWAVSPPLDVATQVTSSSAVADLQPRNLTVLGGKLYFSGQDASGNVSLYASDGTGAGTAPLAVSGAGAGGLVPDNIVSYGGRLYFSGLDATGVSRLWVSDGTSAGTSVLPVFDVDSTNLNLPSAGLNPANLTVTNGKLLFSGTDTNGQTGLWVSDGTSTGTAELAVSGAGQAGLTPNLSDIVSFGGCVYFAGVDAQGSVGLWSSDGTAAGTTELAVSGAGPNGVAPISLTVLNGSLYFGGVDAAGQVGLWKSDGTAAGTSELVVAGAGTGGLSPIALDASDHANVAMSVFGGNLYFSGTDASGALGLWRSDGTAAGTVQVAAPGVTAGASGLLPTDLAVVDLATGMTTGVQDGAAEPTIPASSLGTVPFATFAPVVVGSGPASIVLDVAEEAYQGDAQYTISVDGVQVGPILTATANYAAGQNQTVTVEGSWLVGIHTVSVNFLNDGYGGSASTNRNLYVALDKPQDAVGSSAMFLGYQGAQQIYVQAEPTATVSGGGDTSSDPVSTTPVSTTPVSTPPVSTDPVSTPPVSTTPVSTDPVSTLPVSIPPVSTSPVSTSPITGSPVATLPIATSPVSTSPVSITPVSSGGGSSGGTATTPVLSLPLPVTPVSMTGGTAVVPVTGTAPTVSGATGMPTMSGGTAVLAGTDSVSAMHSEPGYIVSQTSSATTYLTPKASALLSTAAPLSNVVYSQGTDTIAAHGASDLVFASGPAATVAGGSGTLIFVAGAGNYVAGGGTGTDILYGGSGTSVLTAASGAGNILVAGSGNLTLAGGLGGSVLMFGGSGASAFVGSAAGGDTMVGGIGTNAFALTNGDIAFGGPSGPDLFAAGAGSVLVVEGGGATQVQLGSGSLVAFGGAGADTYSVAKGLGGQATIVGFKAGDRISLTGGFTAADASASLRSASVGAFGMALSLSDGTRIVLSGVTMQASQLVVS